MIDKMIQQAETDIHTEHQKINEIVEKNQKRVLEAFRNNRVSDNHFQSTSGYGYNDMGREVLDQVYADVFGAEAAIVRPHFVSGTHTISTALFGLLRPGDELLYITGKPYDTLEGVIGRGDTSFSGSLKEFGIHYNEVPLQKNGTINYDGIKSAIHDKTKVIGIQRSKGYDHRPSFFVQEIKEMTDFVKTINPELIVFVDNCYGEFAEEIEPTHVGVDIMAGSLIKNPGGGIVRAGGYIVGKENLIEKCANRLTAPGLGGEMGATFNMLQEMFQGFFLAPHIVGEALKGAIFTSRFLELMGFATTPSYQVKRTDLIQSVTFETSEQMIKFCQMIQKNSPVDAYVLPVPSEMPGYEDEVIMAAGSFIQGSSIELSADGPIREPYTVYVQGGLTYTHVKIAITESVRSMLEEGLLNISSNS
ncbi:methionine gamma-lyase family protein [Cerasibacillus terrae]|uniref:Methionine gamma-lyase family protein n=1 Tax=Cerasibacillus terrae TaxID=2498845 RepID=A0A5C8P2D8_9BACI|nr:methionine gamma-lyase family protein [Cerasibacillus terrae]TXL67765.1 methionine gamma-lyase family protein [Cerasibacillus terrae]